VGLTEVKRFLAAALYSMLPLMAARMWLPDAASTWRIPISIILLDTCFAFGGTLALRVLRREDYERKRRKTNQQGAARKAVLLIGAGRAGVLMAAEINSRENMDLDVKGFIDDDPKKQGLVLGGKRVLGTTADLSRLVKEHDIDHVVITIAHAARKEFKRVLDVCESVPVRARVIPSLSEILQGRVKVSRIRDVEIEDLLGREPVRLDEESLLKLLSGKTVLVTGAGGSIGSELVRQVARFNPGALLLVERSEFALFNIERNARGLSAS
jgi:FlaA1/EpsC-like NDP-sugar epimerase